MGLLVYAYLDRNVETLDDPTGFLLAVMRMWVHRARAGRCPCAALGPAFKRNGGEPALRDFLIAMTTLDRDGVGRLAFFTIDAERVSDDEARLLGMFDAALAGQFGTARRIAAGLVKDEALSRLTTAVEWLATHLSNGIYVERDQ